MDRKEHLVFVRLLSDRKLIVHLAQALDDLVSLGQELLRRLPQLPQHGLLVGCLLRRLVLLETQRLCKETFIVFAGADELLVTVAISESIQYNKVRLT